MDYDRLRELQEKFEENPRRYFAPLANEYRKGGQPKRAIEICRVQLAQMPGHMSGQIVFGQALYEAGEFEEARKVFETALTLDPENLIALRTLGDMSLQSGNTQEARRWYTRLLDADPKDTAVIALVSEIDASADAAPIPTPKSVPIDEDEGDQQIPYIADAEGAPIEPELQPEVAGLGQSGVHATEPAPAASQAPPPERTAAPPPTAAAPQPPVAPPRAAEPEPVRAPEPEPAAPPAEVGPPPGLERHYPEPVRLIEPLAPTPRTLAAIENEIPLGAEGLHSAIQQPDPTAGLHSALEPKPSGTEGLQARAKTAPQGTEGLKGKPPVNPLAAKPAGQPEEETPLDNWNPPPGANVHDTAPASKDEKMFSGAGPEPFVNETMAQLYLQQGYRQLALKVYYQLAEARPNDQGLKDRIAEIEAADRAAHPDVAAARREPPPIERPSGPPPAPRSPSIEAPTPGGAPESEETPSFDRTPIDSPPSRPSRERESVESPGYEEPRAEPEGIAARQPSIKEFFATLGRRRPPRTGSASGGGGRSSGSFQAQSQSQSPAPAPPPAAPPIATAAPGASLDAVFAGAQVNPSDARAASRLAGAFSGTPGAQSRTPPTPPTPTPRVNPRLPHAPESEEDVAKFRAWLDGLTGE